MNKAPLYIDYFYDIPLPTHYAAGIQILNTCWMLAELGAYTTVFCNQLKDTPETVLDNYGLPPHPNLRLMPLYGTSNRPDEAIRKAVIRTEIRGQRHLIISRSEPGLQVFEALRTIKLQSNQRTLFEAHRFSYTEVKWWRRRRTYLQERRIMRSVDGVLCLSQGVFEALKAKFRLQQPSIILPSGVKVPERPSFDDNNRDIDILYAGKLIKRKGVYDLIKMMQFLPDRHLTLIGGNKKRVADLLHFAEDLGVQSRITMTGFIAPGLIAEYYKRARVGMCPLPAGKSKIAEQFTSPLKVLQMMANGVPIVGTSVPSLFELLVDGETARLVPPNQPEALASAVDALLNDRSAAQRMAEQAYDAVHQYSWENRARKLIRFIDELYDYKVNPVIHLPS